MSAAPLHRFVFQDGVSSLGEGQPTNPMDRSSFVRLCVKFVCFARPDIGVRGYDTPVEVDIEGSVGHLAGALYNSVTRRFPDLHPDSMVLRRGRMVLVEVRETDLDRPVVDALPMAYNDEALVCLIEEAPQNSDQD